MFLLFKLGKFLEVNITVNLSVHRQTVHRLDIKLNHCVITHVLKKKSFCQVLGGFTFLENLSLTHLSALCAIAG